MVEHADPDGAGAGRQSGADFEMGDFLRRIVGVAKGDAHDSFGIGADPQIAQRVLSERGCLLGHWDLLWIRLPRVTGLASQPTPFMSVK